MTTTPAAPPATACGHCDGPLAGRAKLYCARRCKEQARKKRNRPTPLSQITRTCAHCAVSFTPKRTTQIVCCRSCARDAFNAREDANPSGRCVDCDAPFPLRFDGRRRQRCDECAAERVRERLRDANKRRRDDAQRYARRLASCRAANGRARSDRPDLSDVTTEHVAALLELTTHCPLCLCPLADDPGRGDSKQLACVVPPGVGGLHTRANLRVTCATCSTGRPKDASDLIALR